jgi:hypothetical protein
VQLAKIKKPAKNRAGIIKILTKKFSPLFVPPTRRFIEFLVSITITVRRSPLRETGGETKIAVNTAMLILRTGGGNRTPDFRFGVENYAT